MPDNCPCCGKKMRGKEQQLNFKFYFKRGKCFDCVLKEETKIKAEGPEAWKAYEKSVMLTNAEGWFKDADKEVEILKTQLTETTWENAQGGRGEVNISELIERMEKDYLELKSNIKSSFKE